MKYPSNLIPGLFALSGGTDPEPAEGRCPADEVQVSIDEESLPYEKASSIPALRLHSPVGSFRSARGFLL